MEHAIADPVGARRGYLITGAGGQLGAALREVFPEADARTRAELDVTRPFSADADLVLHAAAWTDVDGAESDPAGAELVNVAGTRNVAALSVPVVYFSTDYVFDGIKREPYLESDEPGPVSVYGRTKLEGEQRGARRLGRPQLVALRLDRERTSSGRCCGSARSETR